jgi:hypothetical protein
MAAKRTFPCPVCGGEVPLKAKACHHCGACEKSGWNADATDGLDLPGDDFDYDKFTAEEFGTPRKVRGKELLWKVVAVVLVVLMVIGFVANYFW